jgi:hypothetical protein
MSKNETKDPKLSIHNRRFHQLDRRNLDRELLPPADPDRTCVDTETDGYWWLEARFLPHRNSIQDIHHLLIRLQKAKPAFMTAETVTTVLNSFDPEALVRRWLGMPNLTAGNLCERCGEKPKLGVGPASKYCADCRAVSRRRTKMQAQRNWRSKQRLRITQPLAA